MRQVEVKVTDGGSGGVLVNVGGTGEQYVGESETRRFDVPDGESITLKGGDRPDPVKRDADGKPVTDLGDGNPNGISQAVVAPKMPHTGGNTSIVPGARGFEEKSPQGDPAKERAGGGPDGTAGETPGPKPGEQESEVPPPAGAKKK